MAIERGRIAGGHMRLAGKSAIVTGGARGLGFAIARRYAQEGARVVLADLSGTDEAVKALAAEGLTAIGVQADVTDEPSVAAMVQAAIRECGAIDILVNNAGIASTLTPMPFERQSIADWRRILEVNVIGMFICCKAVAPHMRARRQGRVINLASATALRGAPQMMHYLSSKGAVIAMTRGLATELGPDNILVNALAPGYILTEANLANAEMNARAAAGARARRPLPRDGHPEDVVGAAVFLASEDSSFISGEILSIDGGGSYH